MRRYIYATLAIAILARSASALDPLGDPAESMPKASPRDVEVRLRDGSAVRGELQAIDTLTLKTPYGVLNFPVASLIRVTPAEHMPPQDVALIESAIKDLDNDDFAKRNDAQKKLETFAASAVAILQETRQHSSAEVANRIGAILKKIAAKNPQKLQTDDVVKSEEFEAQGTLQMSSLKLKNRLGDLEIKIEDIESVRWLAKGELKVLDLDAFAALSDWTDTGVDTLPGEKFSVSASGTINLFGNGNSGPTGSNNWGNNVPLVGTLVGKLGANGKQFVIGNGKQWVPQSKERLFVKIHCPEQMMNENQRPSSGKYKLRIANGIWVEEMSMPQEAPDEAPQVQRAQGRRRLMLR